jgi:hypothetical protein
MKMPSNISYHETYLSIGDLNRSPVYNYYRRVRKRGDRMTTSQSESNSLTYEFIVKGNLGSRLQRTFHNLTVTALPDGNMAIVGPIEDQAAFYSVMSRIRDLAIEVISVKRL